MKPKPQAIASVNSHPEIDNMACKGFDLNYHQAFHPNCWSNPIHDWIIKHYDLTLLGLLLLQKMSFKGVYISNIQYPKCILRCFPKVKKVKWFCCNHNYDGCLFKTRGVRGKCLTEILCYDNLFKYFTLFESVCKEEKGGKYPQITRNSRRRGVAKSGDKRLMNSVWSRQLISIDLTWSKI